MTVQSGSRVGGSLVDTPAVQKVDAAHPLERPAHTHIGLEVLEKAAYAQAHEGDPVTFGSHVKNLSLIKCLSTQNVRQPCPKLCAQIQQGEGNQCK